MCSSTNSTGETPVGQTPKTRLGFDGGIPSAVLRFAVRNVVDDDEVHVAWGVEWHPEVFAAVASMSATEAKKIMQYADRLPECSVLMVQGLADLSKMDREKGRLGQGGVSPSAVTAAVLCAMKHVMVTESALPIKRKAGNDIKFPARRLPAGWSIEVDVNDVVLIAAFNEDVADHPLFQSVRANPAVPYGRFLWVALNGELETLSYANGAAMDKLRTDAPSTTVAPTFVEARKNHALQVQSPAGPIAITQHAILRAAERLHCRTAPARVAAWLSDALYSKVIYDVSQVVSEAKGRKLNPRMRVLASIEPERVLIYVISIAHDANYLATVYVANPRMGEIILDALPTLCGMKHD